MKKCVCLNCGHEFEFKSASKDNLGWCTTCPNCNGSFDIDIEDYLKNDIDIENYTEYELNGESYE